MKKISSRIIQEKIFFIKQIFKNILSFSKKNKNIAVITRCKDENYVSEFCNYYISQGIDQIFIIDDNSNTKDIYKDIPKRKTTLIYSYNIISRDVINKVYRCIRGKYKWMINVDIDEYITTKKRIEKTIKEELESTFKYFDCIKVPWVIMSSNQRKFNPSSLLIENNTRWDHDKKHENKIYKFRCRYYSIEVKTIFKTSKFLKITDHIPCLPIDPSPSVVNSLDLKNSKLDPYQHELREKKIENAYLVCFHYRIISEENSINKLSSNYWYKKDKYTLKDLNDSDHSEKIDNNLRIKSLLLMNKMPLLIHIGKCGGSFIKSNFTNLENVHMTQLTKEHKQDDYVYILTLRNPIERFVSAFNHSKILATYPYQNKTYEDLYNDIYSPFYGLKNKCFNAKSKNNPFGEWDSGEEYLKLILNFNSANELAESLSSSDKTIQKKAFKLVLNKEVEHLGKSIGWYLDNGNFIRKYHNRIIYCEDINNIDLKILSRITGQGPTLTSYKRKNVGVFDKKLTLKAINNIKNLYKDTDYKALKELSNHNLISRKLHEDYYYYKI